jgi:hypothetical protein
MTSLTNHPDAIFWLVGILVLANVGSIGACIGSALKIVWWASKVDSRIAAIEQTMANHNYDLDSIREEFREFKLSPQRSKI